MSPKVLPRPALSQTGSHSAAGNTRIFIKAFWDKAYFYAASTTARNQSVKLCRRKHCTVSVESSRRHADVSLNVFTRKQNSTRAGAGEINGEKLSISARRLFLCGQWECKLDCVFLNKLQMAGERS